MTGSLLRSCTSWDTVANFTYSSLSPSCAADLYVPKNNGTSTNPCIIYVHGGAWTSGSKNDIQTPLMTLVRKGFAVMAINYRFDQEKIWPAQLVDVKSAVRLLRAITDSASASDMAAGFKGQRVFSGPPVVFIGPRTISPIMADDVRSGVPIVV